MPRPRKLPDGSHSTVYRPPPVNSQNHYVINHCYTETGAGRLTTVSIPLALKTPDIPGIPEDLVNTLIEMPPEDENMSYSGGGSIGSDASTSFTYDFVKSLMATQNGYEEALDSEPLKRVQNYLAEWRPEIPRYLKEILRHEGLESMRNQINCACDQADRMNEYGTGYRCTDCFDSLLWCQAYIFLSPNRELDGSLLQENKLVRLGSCFPSWSYCGAYSNHKFTVIDTTRIHTISVRFCRCHLAVEDRYQLLRARLYPATMNLPQNVATFSFLEFFQKLSFMSKVSATEYYSAIERMTDNTGTRTPPVRSREVLRMICEWRHLRMLKHAGVGYKGVDQDVPGILAVKCAACPHPGINIPGDWASNREKIWLYKVFFALDANFRLIHFNVSSEARDPGFNKGRAYFVDDPTLQYHLASFAGRWPAEKSDCSNHNAIKLANRRGDHNLSTTGLALATCARHDTIHANSGVDLCLGEELGLDHIPTCSKRQPRFLIINFLFPSFTWQLTRNRAFGAFHTTMHQEWDVQMGKESTKKQWRQMVLAWEANPDKRMPNAYEHTVRKYTMNRTQLELAKEDADLIGNDTAAQAGLELEEQLRRLKFDMKTATEGSTDLVRAKTTERSTSLHRRVEVFAELQALHMPITVILRQQLASSGQTHFVYDLPLLLPSQVFRLGSSSAHDALEQMHKQLLERNWSIDWKRRYGHGVRDGTRSANDVILSTLAEKLGKVGWSADLRELRDSDIRAISRGNEETLRLGEGYVVTSWIWNTSEHEVNKWKLRASEASGDPGASA
ncbi:hypothetical protein EV368DRAFT_68106 [Lentinula lateritia]|nr:hypothetical protein EV368DRAFT_68106 [Lentinula lateritia]